MMRFAVVLILLSLGLAWAGKVKVKDDDLDLDMKGMTLDEAREKWGLLRNLYQIIEQLESKSKSNEEKKRFLFYHPTGPFTNVKELLRKAHRDAFSKYIKAESAFSKKAKNLKFGKVVAKIMPYVKDDTTMAACKTTCTGVAAAKIFGTESSQAKELCDSVCKGAKANAKLISLRHLG